MGEPNKVGGWGVGSGVACLYVEDVLTDESFAISFASPKRGSLSLVIKAQETRTLKNMFQI